MSKEIQVAAFEGGELRLRSAAGSAREAVLALPMSRLLVRMVRVPPEADAVETATPLLQAMSPYPDEPLTVSCETVREAESGTIVLAAALPESAADDIAEALDAAKLSVVRVDALAIGSLRGLWSQLGGEGRRLVLIDGADCLTLIVLDADQPSAIRAISRGADLRRETMLSLLEAEDFGGAHALDAVVLVHEGDGEPAVGLEDVRSACGTFCTGEIRELSVGADAGLEGVAERSAETGTLDALPESWRAVLDETRFKAKLTRNVIVSVGIWLLAMGVLFGVPLAYGYLTDRVKDQCRQHSKAFRSVSETKARVDIIEKYSDHARGALELLKAVSDRLPEGVTVTSWDYKREEGVRIRAVAKAPGPAYEFKNALAAMASADDPEDRVFAKIVLGSLNAQKDGSQKFEVTCQYKGDEE